MSRDDEGNGFGLASVEGTRALDTVARVRCRVLRVLRYGVVRQRALRVPLLLELGHPRRRVIEPFAQHHRAIRRRSIGRHRSQALLDKGERQVPVAELGVLERGLVALGRRQDREPLLVGELRQPAQPRTYPAAAPLDLCLIEGWFVGAAAPGYERLATALDRMIFLEMAEESARDARLGREARRRAAGHQVMSAETVAEFWAQALAPHFATWVKPLRSRADVVLCLDAEHRPTALQIGKPRCP